MNCAELAHRAVGVLQNHRPIVEPFDRADEAALLALLPRLPDWSTAGTELVTHAAGTGLVRRPRVRWQEDRRSLDRWYGSPEAGWQKSE